MTLLVGVLTLAAVASAMPHVIADRPLPALSNPTDVRWIDDDHLLVADPDRGIARLTLTGSPTSIDWLEEWQKPKGPGSRYFHIAVSGDHIVASDFAFAMQWRRRSGDPTTRRIGFEYIGDVDLDGNRLLVTGLHRDETGDFAADGAIAWLGTLSGGERSLRPVLPFRSLNAVMACAGFGLGKVRFLRDGSFIVVPGSESGIYHFSSDGHVQRVWQTAAFGLDTPCDLPAEEKSILATKPLARNQWLNRRAIVDEVIETPAGPALIVRTVNGRETHWSLLPLNGSPAMEPLPITSPSPWAHLSAAVRGKRAVLLIGDREALDGGAVARLVMIGW